ncbi:MAG: helix-turn-helix domain-containing protein, partial [Gemmatimonadaceae bacterium]
VLRAVSLCETDAITASDLGLGAHRIMRASVAEVASHESRPIDVSRPFVDAKRDTIAAFERGYLTQLMEVCGGNVSRAARHARKERRDFRRLLHKYRLDPRAFEPR